MGAPAHRLIVGALILAALMLVDGAAMWEVIHIDWGTLPGPEAGIVSAIITTVINGITGMAGTVVGYYFSASPVEAPAP